MSIEAAAIDAGEAETRLPSPSWDDLGQDPFDNQEIVDAISQTARDYGRRYSSYGTDYEDMGQQARLWVWEHPSKVLRFLEQDHGIRLLARTLRNHLHDYGESAKAAHLGYSRDDLVFYSVEMLRDVLPAFFDPEAWLDKPVHDETSVRRSGGDPAAGGNWVATLADISRAFDKLDADDRDMLVGFYRDDEANKEMAERRGASEQMMSYWHTRALKRLLNHLGGPRPRAQHDRECEHDAYRTGRTAISNSGRRRFTAINSGG